MRTSTVTATIFLALTSVAPALAATTHNHALEARAATGSNHKQRSHGQVARKSKKVRRTGRKQKKCVASPSSSPIPQQGSTETHQSTEAPYTPPAASPTPPPAAPAPPPPPPTGSQGGTIQGKQPCQGIPVGATPDPQTGTGPNGSLAWLSCGIESGGWTPPFIHINELVVADHLGPIYDRCQPFVHLFERYGAQFGIPVVMLAAFAMQESSCNPDTVGGAGEQGLFQITMEKCEGQDPPACRNPEFNTRKGAEYFANQINHFGGNVLAALGSYNGWQPDHTTVGTAYALGETYGCRSMNNLDYLHQYLNGWCQNRDAYAEHMYVYNNLAMCG